MTFVDANQGTARAGDLLQEARMAVRHQVREQIRNGGGPWIMHGLSESLPLPTLLTWSVVQKLMNGDGGLGRMHRRMGFIPGEKACRAGFLDLIGGRIYMDVSRLPEMFFADSPMGYDFNLLKINPSLAEHPPTEARSSLWRCWWAQQKSEGLTYRLHAIASSLDLDLEERIFPEFAAWWRSEKQRDLRKLSNAQWVQIWLDRQEQMMAFASEVFLVNITAPAAIAELVDFIGEHFWDIDAWETGLKIVSAHRPDLSTQSCMELYEVANGRRPLDRWMMDYGHRGMQEMEIGCARWREQPEYVQALVARLKHGKSPSVAHREMITRIEHEALSLRAQLPAAAGSEFDRKLERARRYVPLREDAKHYLIYGFDLLRDMALEAGRRLNLGENLFHLNFEELSDALFASIAPTLLLEQRAILRLGQKKLTLPHFIAPNQVEELGMEAQEPILRRIPVLGVGPGMAQGQVKLARTMQDVQAANKEHVLVCTAIESNWAPFLGQASGMVVEHGGVLSHGVIAAREAGLPVVILPGAMSTLKEGQSVTIDAYQGAILPQIIENKEKPKEPDGDDTYIQPSMIPPVRAGNEKLAIRVGVWGLLVTAVLGMGLFVLPPSWVLERYLVWADWVFWPFVYGLGRPAMVAFFAGWLGLLLALVGRMMESPFRLHIAVDRSNLLRQEMKKLNKGSSRYRKMQKMVGDVRQRRVVGWAMPAAVISGLLLLNMVWLWHRISPDQTGIPAGASLIVRASVAADFNHPVSLFVTAPLNIDPTTPMVRQPVSHGTMLDQVYQKWVQTLASSESSSIPWAERERMRSQILKEIKSVTETGSPPAVLIWKVNTSSHEQGLYPIALSGEGMPPLRINVAIGDRFPPTSHVVLGDSGSPFLSLSVQSLSWLQPPPFWEAFESSVGFDPGWLGTYAIFFLFVSLGGRIILRKM